MKIIQITDHNGSGGVNSFVYDLCKEQCRYAQVMFISFINKEKDAAMEQLAELEEKGVTVRCLGASSKLDAIFHYMPVLRRIMKEFSKGEKCICNLHLKLSVLMGVMAGAGLKNIKLVETYHNTYHHYKLQYKVLHPWISHYIAISYTCGEEMKQRFHTKNTEMTVIPNGVNREEIREIAYTYPVKEHKGILMMTVGRLSYEKNIKMPVKAFAEFCRNDLIYRVIGDGPQREEILAAAQKNNYIEFTGEIPRRCVLANLAEADIVIMPSLWEGRSILQLEAMALDKPLLLSDVPALREVFGEVQLKETELYRRCNWGYLVHTNVPESYQLAIEDFVDTNTETKENMKKNIKKISVENDIKVVAEKYQFVYKKVMGGDAL